MLNLLKNYRLMHFALFLLCAGLIGFALYLQYYQYMEPCPLCFLQRGMIIAMGLIFLVAALHKPARKGAALYATAATLPALAGLGLALRHLWIQSLPLDQVPECGTGISYWLDTMPLGEVLLKAIKGTGECAVVDKFLGVPLSVWTLLFFIGMIVVSWVLVRFAKKNS